MSLNWTRNNLDLIAELSWTHVQLAIVPIALSFLLALPLGWLANRTPVSRSVVITAGSLLYTIPSLPLFLILPAILGTKVLDSLNLVVALTIYGVAIMTRSFADALAAVDATTLDASVAIGYSPSARFFRVELPLAGPVLLAGIRVVSVSTIALVSVGVLVGSQNLGVLFLNGKQRGILEEVVAGIVVSLLIALVFDLVIVLLGKLLMPWNRNDTASRRSNGRKGSSASSGLDGRERQVLAASPGGSDGGGH